MIKKTFIAWNKFDRRSDLLARHLDASIHFIHFGQPGQIFLLPIRYTIQAFKTWSILRAKKPDIVLVQVSPTFAALVVYIYAKLHNIQFIMDAHSDNFIGLWSLMTWLLRFLAKRALTTVVPSKPLAEIVQSWEDCHVSVLGYTPGQYPPGNDCPILKDKFVIAVPSSFQEDEPLEDILEAARKLQDVSFYITGNTKRTSSELLEGSPNNCTFTGYIPYEEYIGLLRTSDAIMVLTNWQDTLLMGAYEAVSLGKPLITSNSQLLRENFGQGTVQVKISIPGIIEGVRQTQQDIKILESNILLLRKKLTHQWDNGLSNLNKLISSNVETRQV